MEKGRKELKLRKRNKKQNAYISERKIKEIRKEGEKRPKTEKGEHESVINGREKTNLGRKEKFSKENKEESNTKK